MAGPTMNGILPIRKPSVILALVIFLSYGFGQTAEDRIGPITSALRNKEFERALELLRPALQSLLSRAPTTRGCIRRIDYRSGAERRGPDGQREGSEVLREDARRNHFSFGWLRRLHRFQDDQRPWICLLNAW